MRNPYIVGPGTVISFSGGRTSGYMLWYILDAHGGTLPDGVVVIFNNTGKERLETLDFVHECQERWRVPVVWLEYRYLPGAKGERGEHTFVIVDYVTASRNGEPFAQAIQARGFLPNPVTRFCTVELKIRTTARYVKRHLGWKEYVNVIGLRADEPNRVHRLTNAGVVPVHEEETLFGTVTTKGKRKGDRISGEEPYCPLFYAGVVEQNVLAWWAEQPFDLQLKSHEGNCDLCFLKGAKKLKAILAEHPELADWWIAQERAITHRGKPETARFRADRPRYAELLQIAQGGCGLGPLFDDADDVPCHCTD